MKESLTQLQVIMTKEKTLLTTAVQRQRTGLTKSCQLLKMNVSLGST